MTISRAKLASAVLLGVLAASTLTARAQNNAPSANTTGRDASFLPTPDAPVALTPAPASVSPASPNPVAAMTAPVSPPVAVAPTPMPPLDLGKPVETGALGDINPESIGLMSASEGGFSAAMWKGTPRLLVEHLLPAMNLPTASPTLNNVAQRFLLTTASVPVGAAESKQTLTSMRAEKLLALGDIKGAWKLALKAPPDQLDEITMRRVVEAGLVSSVRDDVCAKLPNIMKLFTGIEWQKSLVVCQLRAGDNKAAQLSLDVLHTQNIKDEVFFALAEKNILGGSKQLPRQLTPLKPLNLALLRLTNLPLPSEIYAHADAALAADLLQAPAREDVARLALAERMAERNVITGDDLAGIYRSTLFAPDVLANPLASSESGSRLRALLVQAALAEQTPSKRLDLVAKFLQNTSAALLNGAGASVALNMVGAIQPGPDYYAASVSLVRLNMLAGKPEIALEWLKLARRGAVGTPAIAADLHDLWPLTVFSGLESDADYAAHLAQWLDTTLKLDDPKADNHVQREQAAAILLLLEATGFAVPEDDWARVVEAPTFEKRLTPSAILTQRLHVASASHRLGESLMLSLLVDDGVIAGSLSTTTVETIRALHLAGLTADAATRAREVAALLLAPAPPSKP